MKRNAPIRLNMPVMGFAAGALLLYFSAVTKQGIKSGLEICADTLIPSLFPFLCLANIIMLGKNDKASIFSKLFSRIFFLEPSLAKVFLFSLVGGYPLGAMMTAALYKNGKISQSHAKRACLFCFCSGPAFCISAVGENMCKSKMQGIYIFISCALAAIIAGIFLGIINKDEEMFTEQKSESEKEDFNGAIEKSINSMLSICARVIIASAFVCLVKIAPLNFTLKKYFICALEVTSGCYEVKRSPFLLAAVLSFGGISVFLQIKKYLDEIKLPYFKYFSCRILSAVLSGGICKFLNFLFPVSLQTAKTGISVKCFSFSAPLSALLLLSFAVFILDNKRGKLFFEK